MSTPLIIDLGPSSDAQFRDVYGRHQVQVGNVASDSGNVIRKTYHHVSGASANASAAEVVSLDGSNNAQYDLLLRDADASLAVANLTSANVDTWSNTSLLSLRHGTTAIRSGTLAVNNLAGTETTVHLEEERIAMLVDEFDR